MTEATWSLDRLTITGALPPLGHSLTYSPPATPTATTRLPPLPPTPAPTRRPHHGASRECRPQSLTGRLHPWLLQVAFTVGSYWLPSQSYRSPSPLALTGRLHSVSYRWLSQLSLTGWPLSVSYWSPSQCLSLAAVPSKDTKGGARH